VAKKIGGGFWYPKSTAYFLNTLEKKMPGGETPNAVDLS